MNLLKMVKVGGQSVIITAFLREITLEWNMLPDEVRDKAGTKEFIRLVRNLDF